MSIFSNRILVLALLVSSISLAACDSDSGSSQEGFTLNLSGVEPLTNGFHYEGWLIIDGAPVSTGKFNISASGSLVDLRGSAIGSGLFELEADVNAAAAFVLTIEPSGDTDSIPSTTKYLGGDISGDSASLSTAHGSSLGGSFTASTGEYILATPTNGSNTNENSGIWWLNPTGASVVAGLDLPSLPAGWKYEGWVVISGTPVTTGTFDSVSGVDGFDGFSGTQGGPPFPGEDFLVNAPSGLSFPTDLSGGTAVISIEPYPDSDPAPFTLKPLVGPIPASAADHTVFSMNNNASSFPTGSVQLR
ncbi:anti-sigma factor [bacterium]|nr:anti-sigma factor [bacterium]